jgi:tRNA(Arg) A34 adenosine deaminase TadA/7,8-dihydro-6-hydroxymethylpterin-pyrophosphokinase
MQRSIISMSSNFEPTHRIREAISQLAPEDCSRVFLTKAEDPVKEPFHNLTVVAPRTYSQDELRELERSLGRRREESDGNRIEIDLDLQFTGNWDRSGIRRFIADQVMRSDWKKKAFVGIPTRDLISEVVLPGGECVQMAPDQQLAYWTPEVIGVFDLNTMPQLEGGLAHHETFMRFLLEFLKKEWKAPDSPIAAQVVHNGRIVKAALSQGRSTGDSTAHAEMVALREASREFGRPQLKESWLYSTHAPCSMCRETALECGVRGIVWAIDSLDAPKYYKEPAVDIISALRNRRAPILYRGIARDEALSISSRLEEQLPAVPAVQGNGGLVQDVAVQDLYSAVAREYHDPELHPVAFAVAQVQKRLRTELAVAVTGSILDVGCGPEIPPVAGRFVGVDISPGMVAERRRRVPAEESLIGDARNLGLEGRKFDAIFAGLVLDHVESLKDVAAEFSKVLSPGGSVWFTLLSPGKLPEQVYEGDRLRFLSSTGIMYKTPIHRWEEAAIRDGFDGSFDVVEKDTIPLGIRSFNLNVFKLQRRTS